MTWTERAIALGIDPATLQAEAIALAAKPYWVADPSGHVYGFDSQPEAVQFCLDHNLLDLFVNPSPGRPVPPHETHELEI